MKKKVNNSAQIILITGSPAVGKFSVGKKLSEKTNIPLFHNHIIIDLAKELFPNEKIKAVIREQIFFDLLKFAAKQKHSLILTYAYAKNYSSGTGLNDVDLVKRIKKISESHGGLFYSIHLNASHDQILARTNTLSRKKFHKLKDVNEMKKLLKEWDVVTPPPFKDCLVIDNSRLSAGTVVKKILDQIK